MGLEDKFYPDDGTAINKFDNLVIYGAATFGEAYQNLTGNFCKDLTTSLYGTANKISKVSMVPGLILGYIASEVCGSAADDAKFETPLEEELRYEARGMPKHFGRYRRLIPPVIGTFLGILGISEIDNGGAIYRVIALGTTGAGASLLTLSFAEYLSKTNLPNPPKRSLLQKIRSYMKETLFPERVPRPAEAILQR